MLKNRKDCITKNVTIQVPKRSIQGPKPLTQELKPSAQGLKSSTSRGSDKPQAVRSRHTYSTYDAIWPIFQSQNPHPRTELVADSPFQLLIAVILSAQATDKQVNKVTPALFAVASNADAMGALGEEKLRDYIKSIGLYRTKARHIIATCHYLVVHYHGEVPKDRESLEKLPGVGRKTANVILQGAFGVPTIAVDTHIFRVARRIGLSGGKTPLAVEKDLMRVIPKQYILHAHHWLLLHGRYICTARKPKCGECPIQQYCAYYAAQGLL